MAGPLTTHVLDTSTGRPAVNLSIKLFNQVNNDWAFVNGGVTNSDGRLPGLVTQENFKTGVYKMYFDTEAYFQASGKTTFYPYVEVVFRITQLQEHHHVPLLLSPYGFSTYRGS